MQKKKYKSNVAKKNTNTTVQERVFGIALLIVVAIMPLVVRHAVVRVPPELTALYGMTANHDFFAHYKGWVLGISATVIALYYIFDLLASGLDKIGFKALMKSPPIVAACVFLFMAFVSALFSRYRFTSWFGTAERGEGLLILVAYFIVFFAAIAHVRESRHAKLLMYGLAFSSIIMGLIGLGQFLGWDFFTTSLAAWLVTGDSANVLQPRFGMANGTLYNPNTFGKYAAMAAPILLACALTYDGRKWMRLIFFAGGGLMFVGILGSRSLGGFVGTAVAVAVLAVTFICRFCYQLKQRNKMEDNPPVTVRKVSVWLGGATIVTVILVGLYFAPPVNQRLTVMIGRLEAAIRMETRVTDNFDAEGNILTAFRGDEKRFSIVLEGVGEPDGEQQMSFTHRVYDAAGQPVLQANRTETIEESRPGPIILYTYAVPDHGNVTIQDLPMGIIFRGIGLTYSDGRIYAIALNDGLIDLTEPVPAIGFAGRERWGSSRGYIWSRTFPLMPSRTLIGPGPDTYTHIFPQHDVFGKLDAFGNPYRQVDKAHNIYLQTWVTTGGISAIALIFLFAYYILATFISLIRTQKKEGNFIHGLRFGLLVGISAYSVAALATDSTIGSAGVFFVLLGIGYGLNYYVKRVAGDSNAHNV